MKQSYVALGLTALMFLTGRTVSAQADSQTGGAAQGGGDARQCAQAQPVVSQLVTAAMARLEAARQQNSPAQMRAAVDDLQGTLRDLRAQLAPCAGLQGGADPHAGHAMPNAPQTPAGAPGTPVMPPGPATPAPGAVAPAAKAPGGITDPHAGHHMPTRPKPAQPPRSQPTTTPSATTGGRAPDPHAGHTAAGKSDEAKGKEMDPVNGLMVDPATAPKTTYQGQTYYFSSEQSRKEFVANPGKFAKKPKQ